MRSVCVFFISVLSTFMYSQVGVSTDSPDQSSVLDVVSKVGGNLERGVLIPRISDESSVSSPAKGLLIYQTTKNCLMENRGDATTVNWQCLVSSSDPLAKQFYAPSIPIDFTSTEIDLHKAYSDMFTSPVSSSNGASYAGVSLDVYSNTDLNYHLLAYDSSIISDVTISADGKMSYTVVSEPDSGCSYVNVVFEVK